MKSSGPVFTRQNPIQRASKVGKTHYHPSSNQSFAQKKKETTLSPVRLKKRSSPIKDSLIQVDQKVDETDDHCFAAEDGKSVYREHWPSTEWESAQTSNTESSELGVLQDSVLAKYVERFRHGQPKSREERQHVAVAIGEKPLDFWWMSTSSVPLSSTPTKETDKDIVQLLKDDRRLKHHSQTELSQRDRPLSPCRTSLSILSETSHCEFDDTEILQLQEKANRLLLRDDCDPTDRSIHVSSEGLGCSDFSTPLSVDEPLKRPLIPAKASSDSIQVMSSQKPFIISSLRPPTRPEEDILFQWRLRRKMEQARDEPLQHSPCFHYPTLGGHFPSVCQTSASGQDYKQGAQPSESLLKCSNPHIRHPKSDTKEALGSCPVLPALHASDSSVSQPQAPAHVPAHMHFLCDVLPCPIQSSHASAKQNISESPDASQTAVVRKKARVPRNTNKIATDEAISQPTSVPCPFGITQEEKRSQHRRSEKNGKEAEKFHQKQKKSPRYPEGREHTNNSSNIKSSHQRVPKKISPLVGEQQYEERREFSIDRAQSASPVRSALGQVVSEVLFPAADSSTQRMSDSPVSTFHTLPAQSQPSVHPGDEQYSLEVISQLLQEAEDSDEKEFEDDGLLQVLRKQRKWVKEQIREVDLLLNDSGKSNRVSEH